MAPSRIALLFLSCLLAGCNAERHMDATSPQEAPPLDEGVPPAPSAEEGCPALPPAASFSEVAADVMGMEMSACGYLAYRDRQRALWVTDLGAAGPRLLASGAEYFSLQRATVVYETEEASYLGDAGSATAATGHRQLDKGLLFTLTSVSGQTRAYACTGSDQLTLFGATRDEDLRIDNVRCDHCNRAPLAPVMVCPSGDAVDAIDLADGKRWTIPGLDFRSYEREGDETIFDDYTAELDGRYLVHDRRFERCPDERSMCTSRLEVSVHRLADGQRVSPPVQLADTYSVPNMGYKNARQLFFSDEQGTTWMLGTSQFRSLGAVRVQYIYRDGRRAVVHDGSSAEALDLSDGVGLWREEALTARDYLPIAVSREEAAIAFRQSTAGGSDRIVIRFKDGRRVVEIDSDRGARTYHAWWVGPSGELLVGQPPRTGGTTPTVLYSAAGEAIASWPSAVAAVHETRGGLLVGLKTGDEPFDGYNKLVVVDTSTGAQRTLFDDAWMIRTAIDRDGDRVAVEVCAASAGPCVLWAGAAPRP